MSAANPVMYHTYCCSCASFDLGQRWHALLLCTQADNAVALAQAETIEWDELEDDDRWHDPHSFLSQDWSDGDSSGTDEDN
jgi:hypothetical protein